MKSTIWVLALLPLLEATPTPSFPFNSQLPPAARLSTPYSYTISPETFTSYSNITYTLTSAPSWLSIDSSGHLSGTPPNDTVPSGSNKTSVNFTIVAQDSDGKAEMEAMLAVSRRAAPTLLKTLEDQMTEFGDFSAPSSLLYYPSTTFNFSFDPATFSYADGDDDLEYYAISSDGSPLPAWLKFDAKTQMFLGTTPPFESLVSPPQIFGLQFVASDVTGFSAISLDFDITVGTRKLTSTKPLIVLNVTKGGDAVSYTEFPNQIRLDGSPIGTDSGVNVTTKDIPDWLIFDTTSWKFSGSPPDDAESTKFLISFKDSLSDNLRVQVVINLADSLFTDTDPNIDIAIGKDVDFDFSPYLVNASDVALSIDTDQTWLTVDGVKLVGTAPDDLGTKSFQLSVTANSQTLSGVKQTITAEVNVLEKGTSSSSRRSKNKLTKAQIALVVILPIVCVVMIAFMVCCLLQHRRRHNPRPKTIFIEEITGPLPPDLRRDETGPSFGLSPTGSNYGYSQNFPFHEVNRSSQYETSQALQAYLRPAHSDSEMGRDLTAGQRTFRTYSETGPCRSESWVTIDGTSRSPSKAFIPTQSNLGRDLTFQTNDNRSSWYTEGPATSLDHIDNITAPSLPDLGLFPQISEDREIETAGVGESFDRNISMVDIFDVETQKMGAVLPQEESNSQNLPNIHSRSNSSPDVPSSEALPSIREGVSLSPYPSPPMPAHLPPLILDNMRPHPSSRPTSSAPIICPDTAPHPDDVTPTPLSLSRKPSLAQTENLPKPPCRPSFTYTPPPQPAIPRKSSRRMTNQPRVSLGLSNSASNLNARISLGPRLIDHHKKLSDTSLDSIMSKENQVGTLISVDDWKSGASREYLNTPYRELYASGTHRATRRSMIAGDTRLYTATGSTSWKNSLRSDRRRTMTSTAIPMRRKIGSRQTSSLGMPGIRDEYMQSIPISYEHPDVSVVMSAGSSLRLPRLDFGEATPSKHSFATARGFQMMGTVASNISEPGFV